jgi:hypothetical protein
MITVYILGFCHIRTARFALSPHLSPIGSNKWILTDLPDNNPLKIAALRFNSLQEKAVETTKQIKMK